MLRFFKKLSARRRKARSAAKRPFLCPSLENLIERITPSINPVVSGNTLTLEGSAGRDQVVVFFDQTNGNKLTVRVTGQADTVINSSINSIVFNGNAGNDVFINTTNIAATASGGTGNDVLSSGAGDDVLRGGAGNDILFGNAGKDQLFGNSGNDRIFGGAGDDTINGGVGDDVLAGMAGNDTITDPSGNNFLFGNAGDDTITGGSGKDRIFGGTGNDTLNGGSGNDFILGQEGDDSLTGGAGNDVLAGGEGDDRIDGNSGNDFLFGNGGDDHLVGHAGNDVLSGNQGNDVLNGGFGHDFIHGGQGHDLSDRDKGDHDDDAEEQELKAVLSNSSGVTGKVTFEADEDMNDGNFQVRLTGLAPNTQYTVTVTVGGEQVVRQATTDDKGRLRLKVFDTSLDIAAGSQVQVKVVGGDTSVTLTGTFVAEDDDNDGDND